jgi:hypothetical protein
VRVQLRPFYAPDELAEVYDHHYDHRRWPDHIERVTETVRVLDRFAAQTYARSVADLSCGDGAIVNQSGHPWKRRVMGDFTSTGPIETALFDLAPVDMFVCSETVEHLVDPDAVLAKIGDVAQHLPLTTPCGEVGDENPEPYWGWDAEAVHDMLTAAGWSTRSMELFTPRSVRYYTFQVWSCSR